jgi:hypothetical protein
MTHVGLQTSEELVDGGIQTKVAFGLFGKTWLSDGGFVGVHDAVLQVILDEPWD